MATRTLGIIMHGVTGRMGLNQHLVRSILAIRDQGGVALPNGDRVMPDPILVGRNAERIAALAKQYGVARSTTDLGAALKNPNDTVFFDAATTQMRADLVTQAIEAGKHIYCEKPVADQLDKAVALAKLAKQRGVKNGVVQDKLFLPGLRKIRMLREAGFFGRIFAVRGEFGYWVFEGDWGQPAQRPSWNYKKAGGRRHHPRHAVPLALRARQPVRPRAGGELPRRDAHPEPRRRERQDLSGRYRRCRLRDLPARRRRGRTHQFLVGHAIAARRPRHLPGRRHARLGGRRADTLRDAVAREHAAPGVESRRTADDEVPRSVGRSPRQHQLRQWLQDPVGGFHPPRGRRHAVEVRSGRGRERRAARRARA